MRPVVHITVELPPPRRGASCGVTSLGDEKRRLAERFPPPAASSPWRRAPRGLVVPRVRPPTCPARPGGAQPAHDRILRMGAAATPYSFEDLVSTTSCARRCGRSSPACATGARCARSGHEGRPRRVGALQRRSGRGQDDVATVVARQHRPGGLRVDLSRVTASGSVRPRRTCPSLRRRRAGHAVLLFNEADSALRQAHHRRQDRQHRYANWRPNYSCSGSSASAAWPSSPPTWAAHRPARSAAASPTSALLLPTARCAPSCGAAPSPPRPPRPPDFRALAERFELSGGFIKVAAESQRLPWPPAPPSP